MTKHLPSIQLTASQQLLCDILQVSDPAKSAAAANQLREQMGDGEAFAFAQRHEVACMAGHHFQDSDVLKDQRWRDVHEKMEQRMSAFMNELDAIAGRFAEHSIPLVALKNGGIARGLHPCLGCCPMGDLDLLVCPDDFTEAHKILVERNYEFEFRHSGLEANLEAAVLSGSTEYWKELEGQVKLWIDFQCRPVAGKWIRPDQEPSARELMDRSVKLEGTDVRVLSPEDNLLQVALHTAKHSYLRAPGLRLHTDVDRVVAMQPMDWELFESRVRTCDARTPVYFSLALAADLLHTPIPPSLLRSIRPSGWKHAWIARWIQQAGLFEPEERKFGRIGFVTFTALQYDGIPGLWRAIFPAAEWMREQFPGRTPLPILYVKRLKKLLWRRFST